MGHGFKSKEEMKTGTGSVLELTGEHYCYIKGGTVVVISSTLQSKSVSRCEHFYSTGAGGGAQCVVNVDIKTCVHTHTSYTHTVSLG